MFRVLFQRFIRTCPKTGRVVGLRQAPWWLIWLAPAMGLMALIWFLIRVVPKPSRAAYPCQRAAMPLASGFIMWLLGLLITAVSFEGSRKAFRNSRRFAAVLLIVPAILGIGLMCFNFRRPADAMPWDPTDPPNQPVGTAKGVNPGRVVWVHDPEATSWSGDGYWWQNEYTDQDRVDSMVLNGLKSLTGKDSASEAWDALFKHFNGGTVGYTSGEKIAIKLNMNKSSSYNDTNGQFPAPQVVSNLLAQLVSQGVAPGDITVFDASRCINDALYNYCQYRVPGVVYTDNDGKTPGRTMVVKDDNAAIRFSNSNVPDWDACRLPTCVSQAKYLINIGVLRGHTLAGITACAKNNFGSFWRPSTTTDDGWKPNNLHDFIRTSNSQGTYNPLVDLMGHKDLGGKTLLYLVDGLYASINQASASPSKWRSAPFNDDWTSSLFFSQDGVAIESVALDFCAAEPTLAGVVTGSADNYLHEAAQADNPPSGTFYDPNNSGSRLASLGVHEHWDGPLTKRYSRNLGTGLGIELVKAPSSGTTTAWRGNASSLWSQTANWSNGVPENDGTVLFDSSSIQNLSTVNDLSGLTGIGIVTQNPSGTVRISGKAIGLGQGIDLSNASQSLEVDALLTVEKPQVWQGAVSGSGSLTVNGPVAMNGALTVTGSHDTFLLGAISGPAALTKQGSGSLTLAGCNTYSGDTTVSAGELVVNGDLDAAVVRAVQRADGKLRSLITYLETNHPGNYSYHYFGSDNAGDISVGDGGWAYGYFSAELWRMYEMTPASDTINRDFWRSKALLFSENVRTLGVQEAPYGDYNNIFQTLEAAYRVTGDPQWLDAALAHARNKDTGYFNDTAGVYGSWKDPGRITGNDKYWHGFADHTPDLEMMFWAADNNTNDTEAGLWKAHAASHALKFSTQVVNPKTYGITPSTREGTPQRCFFDVKEGGSGTGDFWHGEKKQGWDHETTWSRGQSWITYGLVAAYRAKGDGQVLSGSKTAIDYIINHLPDNLLDQPDHPRRIPGDHVPLWDYDYSDYAWCNGVLGQWDVNQQYANVHDSSAGAMAVSAMFRLVQVLPESDPDRLRYWSAACDILRDLTSPTYLSPEGPGTNAGLLMNCFYGTGDYQQAYVWGDYYFMDALKLYMDIKGAGSGTGTGNVTVASGAVLRGTGAISGAVTNSGAIWPGTTTALTGEFGTLTANISSNLGGKLRTRVRGSTAALAGDKLVATGSADFSLAAATLEIPYSFDGSTYSTDTCVDLLDAGSDRITGAFNVVTPALPSGVSVVYRNGSLVEVIPSEATKARFVSLKIASGATPTAVRIDSFTARAEGDGVLLEWRCVSERQNLGFHLWRRPAGSGEQQWVHANGRLIPGRLTSLIPKLYRWYDSCPSGRYEYRLESEELSGKREFHKASAGPVNAGAAPCTPEGAKARLERMAEAEAAGREAELARNLAWIGRLPRPEASQCILPRTKRVAPEKAGVMPRRFTAAKVVTSSRGIVSVSQAQLPEDIQAPFVRIWREGRTVRPLACSPSGVVFWAPGYADNYTDKDAFFIEGARSPTRSQEPVASSGLFRPAVTAVTTHTATTEQDYHEIFYQWRQDLMPYDYPPWFSTKYLTEGTTQSFSLSATQVAGGGAMLTVTVWSESDLLEETPDHKMQVLVNGAGIGEVEWDGGGRMMQFSFAVPAGQVLEGENRVELRTPALNSGKRELSFLHNLKLEYTQKLQTNGALEICAFGQAGTVWEVRGLPKHDVWVVNVTEAQTPELMRYEAQAEKDGSWTVRFRKRNGTAERFYVAPKGMEAQAVSVTLRHVAPAKAGHVYWAVGPDEFGTAVQPLLDERHKDGLRPVFLDQEALFDAYNHGRYGPLGIQRAVRALRPKYLLLLGRTTYDYHNYEGKNMDPLCPTLLVSTTYFGQVPGDAMYGDLGKGYPEVAVGRIPVISAAELQTAAQRILGYERRRTSERKGVLLADRVDAKAGEFGREADSIGNFAEEVEWKKIYVEETHTTPQNAREELLRKLDEGAELVFYVGHGNSARLGASSIINSSDCAPWKGNAMLLMASCNGTYFYHNDPSYYGLVQRLMTQAEGGVPGAIGSTTYTCSGPHVDFMREVFRRAEGDKAKWSKALLGAQRWAWVRAKTRKEFGDFVKAECLLGDPAMPVLPKTKVPVTSDLRTHAGLENDF